MIYKTLAYMKANRAWSMSYRKDFAKSDSDELTAALYDGIFPKLSPDGQIVLTTSAAGNSTTKSEPRPGPALCTRTVPP